jgi:hypothetical protein
MVLAGTFEWRGQARRGRAYLALGIGVAALYLGLTNDVSPVIPALAALYVALVLFRLIMHPTQGVRLGAERLSWFTGIRRHSVAFDDLAGVSIGQSPSGRTVCVVSLLDGNSISLPGVETVDPAQLMREFGRRGVRISA